MTGERTILRGTTVIDVHDGSAHRAVDVTIDGGRIASVTTTSDDHPAGVTVVDAQETYAVPGFCDMHAHPLSGRRDAEGSPSRSVLLAGNADVHDGVDCGGTFGRLIGDAPDRR